MHLWSRRLVVTALGATPVAAMQRRTMATAAPPRAWLDIEQGERLLTIRAMAELPDGATYRYVLEAEKTGASGHSRNRQAGQATGPGEALLSTLGLGIGPNDAVSLRLELYAGDDRVDAVEEIIRGR
jgi:hypothetical protein